MNRLYRFNTFIVICLALLFVTAPAAAQTLHGFWEWDYTYGGIAGMTFDPGTEGHSKQLVFYEDGTARAFRDEVPYETGTWNNTAGLFIDDVDIFTLAGGTAEFSNIGAVEYVVLRAPCCDMYDHHLHRRDTILDTVETTFAAIRILYH